MVVVAANVAAAIGTRGLGGPGTMAVAAFVAVCVIVGRARRAGAVAVATSVIARGLGRAGAMAALAAVVVAAIAAAARGPGRAGALTVREVVGAVVRRVRGPGTEGAVKAVGAILLWGGGRAVLGVVCLIASVLQGQHAQRQA
jgi:hypothetical protein